MMNNTNHTKHLILNKKEKKNKKNNKKIQEIQEREIAIHSMECIIIFFNFDCNSIHLYINELLIFFTKITE